LGPIAASEFTRAGVLRSKSLTVDAGAIGISGCRAL